ncbi:beta-ketoacyl synthase N-terminal-like domain-containing protein, partial [Streptomyces caeruleatus]
MIQTISDAEDNVGNNRAFANQNPCNEPIAIVGIGCNLPGGVRDPESYWKLIEAGEDAIQET